MRPEPCNSAWTDSLRGSGSQQSDDVDVFALFDAMEFEGIPLPEETQVLQQTEAPAASNQRPNHKSTLKLEKLRARNRQAQARYRQKNKEELEQLESDICSTRSAIKSAHEKHRELLNRRAQLTKQCSTSTAALEAIFSVSHLLPPVAIAGPDASPQQHHKDASAFAPKLSVAPTPLPPRSVAVAALSGQRISSERLFQRTGARVPPRLTSFSFHRAISIDHLKPANSEPSIHDFDFRRLAGQFQASEATKCGCGVSDIAWYPTTHVTVAEGTSSQPSAAGKGIEACSGSTSGVGSSQTLSFSTTFSSGACIASFILMYFHLSLENLLSLRAMEFLARNNTDGTINGLTSNRYDPIANDSLASCEGGHRGASSHHKRHRDASDGSSHRPSATRQKPLKSTAEVMAIARVPEALLESCKVTCGVGGVMPMKAAVRKVLRDAVKRFSGIVPLEILSQCCEQVVELEDLTLFSKSPGSIANSKPPSSSSANAPTPKDTTPPSSGGQPGGPNEAAMCPTISTRKPSLFPHCITRDTIKSLNVPHDTKTSGGDRNCSHASEDTFRYRPAPAVGPSEPPSAAESSPWVARKAQQVAGSVSAKTEDSRHSVGVASGLPAASKKTQEDMLRYCPAAAGLPKGEGNGKGCEKQYKWGIGWEKHYKVESQKHMLAVMLVVRAELMTVVDTLPEVVEEVSKTEKLADASQVMEQKYTLCQEFVLSKLLTTLASPKLSFNLILEGIQPSMGSYYQVDNMHVELYKEIKPSPQQRACMAEFWMAWERRKRQLDGDMHAARMLLASLPSHIPLPHEFLSHLNTLLATEFDTNDSEVSTVFEASHASETYINPRKAELMQRFCARARSPQSPQSTPGSHSNNPCDPQLGLGIPMHRCDSDSTSNSNSGQCDQNSRVWFLGQFPEDMERAERALQELQYVQRMEQELHADLLSSQMPGALLDAEQCMSVWDGLFMSYLPPPDSMELCQIAATQQNRGNLFQEPFPGAAMSGCFRHVLTHDAKNECGSSSFALSSEAAALRASVLFRTSV